MRFVRCISSDIRNVSAGDRCSETQTRMIQVLLTFPNEENQQSVGTKMRRLMTTMAQMRDLALK
jgi:hypothetical protein